jgi:hypothetical protein|tara:strand:- start:67 stop:267 length:201 start_codon:yes stop_codon:yes gene_type:complete
MTDESFFLGLPDEFKLRLLKDSKAEGLGMFLRLLKMLLDAPLREGGISSSVIDDFLKDSKDEPIAK